MRLDLSKWRENRGPGWHKDVGYLLQDVLQRHHYRIDHPGSKPEAAPNWHPCTCGWEGYWSDFEPHVADHLRRVAREGN